jgi:glycosyltransferase involved in cell wall biosynthesis
MSIAVNARVIAFARGGQQRVTEEILRRLPDAEAIAPATPLGGAKGHLWEQFVLPTKLKGRVLWSPSATGPLIVRRQVLTLHDVAYLDAPEFFSASFRRAYAILTPLLARRVAALVTVSEFSRQRIAARLGLAAERIRVIENGVSDTFRAHAPEEIAATRAALDLPARYLLVQATSDRRKNLARLAQAWSRALPVLPEDLMLVVTGHRGRSHVFGEGPEVDEGLFRARFLGFVAEEHLGPLTAGAEAFLFPSLYEGFGLPVIEAMACGTPVMTSNVTSLPEVAGDAALLIDPTDVDAIAAAIVRIASDGELRENLKRRGEARARLFSWDRAAEKYARLFAEIAGLAGA